MEKEIDEKIVVVDNQEERPGTEPFEPEVETVQAGIVTRSQGLIGKRPYPEEHPTSNKKVPGKKRGIAIYQDKVKGELERQTAELMAKKETIAWLLGERAILKQFFEARVQRNRSMHADNKGCQVETSGEEAPPPNAEVVIQGAGEKGSAETTKNKSEEVAVSENKSSLSSAFRPVLPRPTVLTIPSNIVALPSGNLLRVELGRPVMPILSRDEYLACHEVWLAIAKHPDSSLYFLSVIAAMTATDPRLVDLKLIGIRLMTGYYKNVTQFLQDMVTMFKGHIFYANTTGENFTKMIGFAKFAIRTIRKSFPTLANRMKFLKEEEVEIPARLIKEEAETSSSGQSGANPK